MTHGIVLTNNGIYHHRNQNKVGGSINQSNNMIRRLSSQINNPSSTGIAGLGTQSDILSRSAFKPSGTSIIFGGGGNLTSQMSKLNFNTNKKNSNVRLRL